MTDSLLSENDLKLVQSILDNHRIRRVRRETGVQDLSGPEKYVMLPPSGGISAVSDASTEGAAPGSALCSVYRILNGVLSDTGKTRTVFNLSGTAITQQWIAPERDKYGSWIIDCACEIVEVVSAGDPLVCGGRFSDGADTLWRGSGFFTSTIKDSQDINSVDGRSEGIAWDGTDTLVAGDAQQLLIQFSGQFTSTIKQTHDVSLLNTGALHGISWDDTNGDTLIVTSGSSFDDKLFRLSGKFTSTVHSSRLVGDIVTSGIVSPVDLEYRESDGATLFSNNASSSDAKNYLIASPRFSTTILSSMLWDDVKSGQLVKGLSWDKVDTNAMFSMRGSTRDLFYNSGFSTTVLDSLNVDYIADPTGMSNNLMFS